MKEPVTNACPHCGVGITEQEIKTMWGRYTNANRKVRAGGRPRIAQSAIENYRRETQKIVDGLWDMQLPNGTKE